MKKISITRQKKNVKKNMYLHKHCNYMSAYYIIIMIVIWILINVSKKKMMLNLNKTLTTKTTDNQIEQKKIICEQRKKN